MISNFNQLQTLYLEIILQFLHYLNSTSRHTFLSILQKNPPSSSYIVIRYIISFTSAASRQNTR